MKRFHKSGPVAGVVSYLYNDRSKKGDAKGSLLVSCKNANQYRQAAPKSDTYHLKGGYKVARNS